MIFAFILTFRFIVFFTGKIALEKHVTTPKHSAQIHEASTSRAISEFVIQKSTSEALKVWAIEGTLAYHTVKHHQSLEKKLIAFAGDNTNTNFGGLNRKSGENIFTRLKTNLNSNLVGIGCPAHVLHNGIHHGIDQFGSFDIESIVVKIFNYFSIYTVRTHELKEFCEFVEVEFRNLLSHSKTRWLSLLPAVERIL